MSVNMRNAIPFDKKHTRFGNEYWDIDFEFEDRLTNAQYVEPVTNKRVSPVIGKLQLASSEIQITEKEAMKIIDTLTTALESTSKAYNLGLLQA